MRNKYWRVGFDARLASTRHAGIGRYSEELLRGLVKHSQDYPVKWIIFVHDKDQLPWLAEIAENDRIKVILAPVRHYTMAEQTVWWWQLQKLNLDLLHVPHFNVPVLYQGDMVVTIHDLLWHEHRDPRATTLSAWQHRLKYQAYRFVSQQAMTKSKLIFVPSQVVKSQVKQHVNQSRKIMVTSEGLSKIFQTVPPVGRSKRSSRKKERAPYFVYTGSLYPHKNVDVALQALQQLPKWSFYVVSSRSVFTEEFMQRAEELGVQSQLRLQHGLTDQQMLDLYQDAVALVQPSRAEGFGLTGLEALAVGCSVIASDIPIFREVYQHYFHPFDNSDPNELVQKLQQLKNNPDSLAVRREAQRYAQRFDWEDVAQKTWASYQQILNSN